MKKLIVLLLFVVCLVTNAYALEIDLSGYTIDDLIELNKTINEEIENRIPQDWSVIGPGRYVVGTDIAPGTYELYDINVTSSHGGIGVYESIQDQKDKKQSSVVYLWEGNQTTILILDEGMVIVVEQMDCKIRPIKNGGIWIHQ